MATEQQQLFPATLLPPPSTLRLPEGYRLRPLEREDYQRGFLDVLRVLTKVGDISAEEWVERYDWMAARREYFVVCVVNQSGTVVGVGSLIVELKLYLPPFSQDRTRLRR